MVNIQEEIKRSIERLSVERKMVRETEPLSFGTIDECMTIFKDTFIAVDKTMSEFEWLPEYNEIVKWMSDTKGQGLCLTGSCGRGKSTIITGVIPLAFHLVFRRIVKWNQAYEIPSKYEDIMKQHAIVLNDVGAESLATNFGSKFEAFSVIAEECEQFQKLLFISTNLDPQGIIDRYDSRILDRVRRLCKVVEFRGASLRNINNQLK